MHARLSAPSAARPSTFASTLTSSHQASSGAVGIGVLGVGAEHLGWTLGLGAHLSTAMPAPVTSFLPLHFPCLVQVSLLSPAGVRFPESCQDEVRDQKQLLKDAAAFLLSCQIPGLVREGLQRWARITQNGYCRP